MSDANIDQRSQFDIDQFAVENSTTAKLLATVNVSKTVQGGTGSIFVSGVESPGENKRANAPEPVFCNIWYAPQMIAFYAI